MSCWGARSGEQRLDPRSIDAIDVSQTVEPFLPGKRSRPAQRFVRMVLEDPKPQLSPHFGLANTLDDLDAGFAQNANPLAIDARVRISNANHDASDPARGDRSRACRRASMERARLERRVERRSDHLLAACFGIARSRDLGVIFRPVLGCGRVRRASRSGPRSRSRPKGCRQSCLVRALPPRWRGASTAHGLGSPSQPSSVSAGGASCGPCQVF